MGGGISTLNIYLSTKEGLDVFESEYFLYITREYVEGCTNYEKVTYRIKYLKPYSTAIWTYNSFFNVLFYTGSSADDMGDKVFGYYYPSMDFILEEVAVYYLVCRPDLPLFVEFKTIKQQVFYCQYEALKHWGWFNATYISTYSINLTLPRDLVFEFQRLLMKMFFIPQEGYNKDVEQVPKDGRTIYVGPARRFFMRGFTSNCNKMHAKLLTDRWIPKHRSEVITGVESSTRRLYDGVVCYYSARDKEPLLLECLNECSSKKQYVRRGKGPDFCEMKVSYKDQTELVLILERIKAKFDENVQDCSLLEDIALDHRKESPPPPVPPAEKPPSAEKQPPPALDKEKPKAEDAPAKKEKAVEPKHKPPKQELSDEDFDSDVCHYRGPDWKPEHSDEDFDDFDLEACHFRDKDEKPGPPEKPPPAPDPAPSPSAPPPADPYDPEDVDYDVEVCSIREPKEKAASDDGDVDYDVEACLVNGKDVRPDDSDDVDYDVEACLVNGKDVRPEDSDDVDFDEEACLINGREVEYESSDYDDIDPELCLSEVDVLDIEACLSEGEDLSEKHQGKHQMKHHMKHHMKYQMNQPIKEPGEQQMKQPGEDGPVDGRTGQDPPREKVPDDAERTAESPGDQLDSDGRSPLDQKESPAKSPVPDGEEERDHKSPSVQPSHMGEDEDKRGPDDEGPDGKDNHVGNGGMDGDKSKDGSSDGEQHTLNEEGPPQAPDIKEDRDDDRPKASMDNSRTYPSLGRSLFVPFGKEREEESEEEKEDEPQPRESDKWSSSEDYPSDDDDWENYPPPEEHPPYEYPHEYPPPYSPDLYHIPGEPGEIDWDAYGAETHEDHPGGGDGQENDQPSGKPKSRTRRAAVSSLPSHNSYPFDSSGGSIAQAVAAPEKKEEEECCPLVTIFLGLSGALIVVVPAGWGMYELHRYLEFIKWLT